MRYIKFLNETNVDDVVELIKQKCQPFLKEWDGNNFLYRGMKHSFTYDIKQVRVDRKPKDIPLILHEMLDKEFKKQFGWNARSNSVFCTGNKTSTEEYGNAYVIFPCDNYKYISSEKVEDLYLHLLRWETTKSSLYKNHFEKTIYNKQSILDNYRLYYDDYMFLPKLELFFKDLVKTYTNRNLNRLILVGNEILINCKQYIAIREIDINEKEFLRKIL